MEKLKLTKEQKDSTVELVPVGLIAQDKTIQEAMDYVDKMSNFDAHLAFYILWNAIGKDYILVPREIVQSEQ